MFPKQFCECGETFREVTHSDSVEPDVCETAHGTSVHLPSRGARNASVRAPGETVSVALGVRAALVRPGLTLNAVVGYIKLFRAACCGRVRGTRSSLSRAPAGCAGGRADEARPR